MGYSILSEDFVAISLFLSEGDIHLTIEELVDHAVDYQNQSKRKFGVTKDDFRSSFPKLFWEFPPKRMSYPDLKKNTIFKETISKILSYYDVYFNDEGEHWCTFEFSRKNPSKKNLAMKKYFTDNVNASPEQVLDFLKEINYDVIILETCSM